jgi:enterochelin esterase family protein
MSRFFNFYVAAALLLLSALPLAAQDLEIGPNYQDAPQTIIDPAVPKGVVHDVVMTSAESKIYPGIKRIENEITQRRDQWGNRIAAPEAQQSEPAAWSRHIHVYVPKQYVPNTPAKFMVIQDGSGYVRWIPTVLDNLIAAKRVPVMIAIMIDSGGSDAQGSQRGLEYDTMSGRYAEFIEQEVLPKLGRELDLTFSKNPEDRAAMGGSSGAAAAFSMAWYHPELYHRVLSYSGTFVNQQSPPNPQTPRGAWEYHATLIPNSPRKPIRIWMEVGEMDNHATDPEESWHNWPLANRRMAEALKTKGYQYRFVFAKGAKHVDQAVVGQTLPSALEWLWQN